LFCVADTKVFDRGAQAAARGAARCLSQVLDRGAQALARGAARCAPQVLDRVSQAAARGAATLPQQKKSNSKNIQRSRIYVTVFICTLVEKPSRPCTFDEFESFATPSRRRWRMFQLLLHRRRLRHKTSPWASDSRRLAGEEQLGRFSAEQSKYYQLYLYSGRVALAAMYLRRVPVAGRAFAAALTHVSTFVTPPAPAA
jgi:hypothetical protein